MRQLMDITGIAISAAILCAAGYVFFKLPGIGTILGGIFLAILALLAVSTLTSRLFKVVKSATVKSAATETVAEEVRKKTGIAKMASIL